MCTVNSASLYVLLYSVEFKFAREMFWGLFAGVFMIVRFSTSFSKMDLKWGSKAMRQLARCENEINHLDAEEMNEVSARSLS